MADLFLSYSRSDEEFVRRVAQALEAAGKELWVDVDDIGPAAPWREEIQRGLESCDGFVFVLTPASLTSVECGKELTLALGLSKRIVPVVHLDVDPEVVPEALARLNWVPLRDSDDFEAGVAGLVEALEQDLEWVRAHTRLGERAEEWAAHGRSGAYVLHGTDLVEAETLVTGAAGKDPALSAHQLEYVAAGRTIARRRQRWLLGSVSLALVVAVVLSLVALHERGTALTASHRAITASHRAQSRQLAADAEVQLGTDPELSVLLAEHAYDIDPTSESVATLRHALVSSFIRMRVQPPDGVQSAQLTPDGSTLVTLGRSDGVVRRWSYPSGKPLGALPGVVADDGQVAVNPANGRILVADHGTAEVFTGAHRDLRVGSDVTAVAWNPNGRVVLTGTSAGRVVTYHVKAGVEDRFAYGLSGPVERLAESANGHFVAASDGQRVLLADFRTTPVHVPLLPTDGPCPDLAFSPDGSRLLSYGGVACASMLLDTATALEVPRYSHYPVDAAAFSPNGTELVVGGAYGVSVHPGNGREAGQYLGHLGPITAAAFVAFSTGSSDFVATAGEDGTIRVWDAGNPASTQAVLRADETALAALTVTPDGRHLVTVDADQRTARVWDDPPPSPAVSVGDTSEVGLGDILTDAALSPDGRSILARDDGGLELYDARTAGALRAFTGSHARPPMISAVGSTGFLANGSAVYEATTTGVLAWRTSDGTSLPGYRLPDEGAGLKPTLEVPAVTSPRLLVGIGDGDTIGSATIRRLDLADPTTGAVTRVSDRPVTAAAISPDGSRVAFATDRGVDVRSGGRTRLLLSTPDVDHLAFSADGSHLALADGDRVRVVAVAGGKPTVTLSVPGVQTTSLTLDEAGEQVAAGGSDGRARLWTVPDGRLLVTATETSTPNASTAVDTVRLSSDDRFLLTGVSTDDTELWDVSDGVRLYAWPSTFAGWSPAANRVLTLQNAAQTWSCAVCVGDPELRALAARSTTRDLTAAERARYLAP